MSDKKRVLSEEEKEFIKALGNSLYTPDYVEEWINRNDDVFVNALAALSSMGAKGFFDCVRLCIKSGVKPKNFIISTGFEIEGYPNFTVSFMDTNKAKKHFNVTETKDLKATAAALIEKLVVAKDKTAVSFGELGGVHTCRHVEGFGTAFKFGDDWEIPGNGSGKIMVLGYDALTKKGEVNEKDK